MSCASGGWSILAAAREAGVPGAPVYFCDSHSPWPRGSNENTNGLLRDYFPKGTALSLHSPQHLLAVENEGGRPRSVPGVLGATTQVSSFASEL